MKLIRDYDNVQIELMNDDGFKVLEFGFMADEFICTIYTSDPIILSEEDDAALYTNLMHLMQNEYTFSTNLCMKTKDKIVWLSDQFGDLEDEEVTDKINRLVIEYQNNHFKISCRNPYLEKLGLKRMSVICFSPAGNGIFSKNLKTGLTFQDDIIIAIRNTLNEKNQQKHLSE